MANVQHRPTIDSQLKSLESRLSRVEKGARLNAASISKGGLTVRDQGNVTIQDGGNLLVTDGGDVVVEDGGEFSIHDEGKVNWYDSGDRVRIQIGRLDPPEVPGVERIRLIYKDSGGAQRVVVGEIASSTGALNGEGILVEAANGVTDVFVAHQNEAQHGTANGTCLRVVNENPGIFYFRRPGDAANGLQVEIATTQTSLIGGDTTTSGLASRLVLGSDFEVRCRDGANSTYIPIAASSFITRTSSADTKEVLDDPTGSALEQVRSVPIRRWRHKTAPATDHDDAPTTGANPERLGPMVEDVPEGMTDGEGIDLAAAVWTLWGAVQEQAQQIEELRAQVVALTNIRQEN